ncbi:MAG: M55 family metallopeptidase [Armatimonadetes bacterium]|nr:M55 family metallopeptidase [Armatimonadota bacterium]
MNVFVSADIEGITGLVSWSAAGRPHSDHYDWPFARRMMTHDVNAAIRGARAAGAKRIVVKDSHGTSRNLLVDELEPGIELISGTGPHPQGMMTGLDKSFDCAMLVGYHAMAGTWGGVMEHTINGSVHRFWINDMPAGEIAMSAATAGQHGVPLVFVSSDDKGCAEAAALIEGLTTATVKYGMGRYIGRLLHPSVTGPLIEDKVREAVSRHGDVRPWSPQGPVTVRIEQNQTDETDAGALLLGWTRLDGYTFEFTADDWDTAHRAARRAMAHTSFGAGGNR